MDLGLWTSRTWEALNPVIFHGKKDYGISTSTHMVFCTLSSMPADSLLLKRINYAGEEFQLYPNLITNLHILPYREKIVMNQDNEFENKNSM